MRKSEVLAYKYLISKYGSESVEYIGTGIFKVYGKIYIAKRVYKNKILIYPKDEEVIRNNEEIVTFLIINLDTGEIVEKDFKNLSPDEYKIVGGIEFRKVKIHYTVMWKLRRLASIYGLSLEETLERIIEEHYEKVVSEKIVV